MPCQVVAVGPFHPSFVVEQLLLEVVVLQPRQGEDTFLVPVVGTFLEQEDLAVL